MLAIGVMSGTSLDGVDVCLLEIKKLFTLKFKKLAFTYLPYEPEFKKRLLDISTNTNITIQKICSMNVEISKKYIKAIQKLLESNNIDINKISFIAIHGQTVWHNPDMLGDFESSTLQLGDPSFIAYFFNCKVVSNFRMMDMASGGSGAPLVPFANYLLFSSKKENIALQNIGGISNVTFLKKKGKPTDIIAFDTGVGNMLIDSAMKRLFGKGFDDCGKIAKKGKIITSVLRDLMKDDYLFKPYPKSTGRERYNEDYLSEIILKIKGANGSDEDVITTLAAYTVDSIIYEYKRFLPKVDRMILSGGGAFNEYMVDRLKHELPCIVEVRNDLIESLEAFSFGILGYCTLKHIPSNVPSVTGASKRVVLGNITNPKVGKRL